MKRNQFAQMPVQRVASLPVTGTPNIIYVLEPGNATFTWDDVIASWVQFPCTVESGAGVTDASAILSMNEGLQQLRISFTVTLEAGDFSENDVLATIEDASSHVGDAQDTVTVDGVDYVITFDEATHSIVLAIGEALTLTEDATVTIASTAHAFVDAQDLSPAWIGYESRPVTIPYPNFTNIILGPVKS